MEERQRQESRKHIFVVNGTPAFLNLMRDLLQDERYNVTTTNFVPRSYEQIAALLRAAGVPLETRKVLLGHRNGDITSHYSAPELAELLEAANRVCTDKSGKTPALVVLKQKTAIEGSITV